MKSKSSRWVGHVLNLGITRKPTEFWYRNFFRKCSLWVSRRKWDNIVVKIRGWRNWLQIVPNSRLQYDQCCTFRFCHTFLKILILTLFLCNSYLFPLVLWSMWDLGMLQDQLPGISIPSHFSPASKHPFSLPITISLFLFPHLVRAGRSTYYIFPSDFLTHRWFYRVVLLAPCSNLNMED